MPTISVLFPTSVELSQIEQAKLPVLTQDDLTFELFPMVNKDSARVQWEQLDNYTGLQEIRGLNGAPTSVKLKGGKRYEMEPGYYGEFVEIMESDLVLRRQMGTLGTPIDVKDLVYQAQDQLLQRRIDRIRYIVWTLLTTGTFSVSGGIGGGILHKDTYPIQTASAATAWSDHAASTPLADLRALKLKHRGYSTRFDQTATMAMNLVWANHLLNNSNAADLGGKRRDMGATFNGIGEVNEIMAANDLPKIKIYDETYFTDAAPTTPVPFIADAKVVVIGKRTSNAPVGEYQMTRNGSNPSMEAGPYTFVKDSLDQSDNPVPRKLDVHDGHNGGIALHFPSSVVVLSA